MNGPTHIAVKHSRRLTSALRAGRVWVYISLVGATAIAIWAHNIARFDEPYMTGGPSLPWWILAPLFYLAEAYVVHLRFRNQAHTLSMSEVGLVLALFFASPATLLAAQVLGVAFALAVNRRQRAVKFAFNLAQIPLCSGVAVFVFRLIATTGDLSMRAWLIALLVAALVHVLGVALVSGVIAVVEAAWSAPHLLRTLLVSLIGTTAASCLGLLAAELLVHDPRSMLLLILPVIACLVSFRGYMEQSEQRERVEFLYESMRATHGAPEFGLAVGQLLVAVRRLLRAEYAEIVLLSPHPNEPVLRSVSGIKGELLMHAEELCQQDEAAIAIVETSGRPVLLPKRRDSHSLDSLLATRGISDGLVGVLRGEQRTIGLIIAGDRAGDVGTFDEADLALFETFVGHTSVLLENGRLETTLAQLTDLQEELENQAYHDALTGLPNRVLFAERVAEALQRTQEAGNTPAVLFLDLDRFKLINDSWGHAVGDELLTKVADRLRGIVRPGDTPARLGGDEFAVLLEATTIEDAMHAAERLLQHLDGSFSIAGREARVHASVGVSVADPTRTSADELLREADIAMYTAKADASRRVVLYERFLHDQHRRRSELALELEQAVELDEIVVVYQPVVSLLDGSIQAFEALARWQHPERGLLAPKEFLDVAEESGLIPAIGESVLEQALRCASMWKDASPHASEVQLWVNLSPCELANERLIEDFALALTRARFDAHRVTVEITESSVIRDELGALGMMRRLRDLGLRLSIDDFGTGYSSLARLSDFPIEMLKLAKPFVDGLGSECDNAGFVDGILRLARSLGLATVAEGIERVEQARVLMDLGCGLGQGYLFSHPLTSDDVFRLLRHGGADEPIPKLRAEYLPDVPTASTRGMPFPQRISVAAP